MKPLRGKLKNLIGKEKTFTAILAWRDNGTRILLKNVKHKGKEYTDHINTFSNCGIEKWKLNGQEVSFTATAFTYTDSKNIRKYGLNNIKHLEALEFSDILHECQTNQKNKWRRKTW